jgi:hypothetical protein
MGLNRALFSALCAGLLLLCGASLAEEYRPGEFLGLDLAPALLSPKPLGPATEFAPVPVQAKTDRRPDAAALPADSKSEPQAAAPKLLANRNPGPAAHARSDKPRPVVRTRLARRHSNPLNAQARDASVQVWPCRSGGICNWKQ